MLELRVAFLQAFEIKIIINLLSLELTYLYCLFTQFTMNIPDSGLELKYNPLPILRLSYRIACLPVTIKFGIHISYSCHKVVELTDFLSRFLISSIQDLKLSLKSTFVSCYLIEFLNQQIIFLSIVEIFLVKLRYLLF